jgi:hypothetical protein
LTISDIRARDGLKLSPIRRRSSDGLDRPIEPRTTRIEAEFYLLA